MGMSLLLHVVAAESFKMTAHYEGRASSGSEDDIIAKVELSRTRRGRR